MNTTTTINTDTLIITIGYNDDGDLLIGAWRGELDGQPNIDGCALAGDELTRQDICGATEYAAEEILAAVESARSEMGWTCKLSGDPIPAAFIVEFRSLELPTDNWYAGSPDELEQSPYWGSGAGLFARIEEPAHPDENGWYPVQPAVRS